MCIVGKMVYTYNWGTYINKYVYIVLPIEMSLIHLRTIVEPCILMENGIYMIRVIYICIKTRPRTCMWDHVYLLLKNNIYIYIRGIYLYMY